MVGFASDDPRIRSGDPSIRSGEPRIRSATPCGRPGETAVRRVRCEGGERYLVREPPSACRHLPPLRELEITPLRGEPAGGDSRLAGFGSWISVGPPRSGGRGRAAAQVGSGGAPRGSRGERLDRVAELQAGRLWLLDLRRWLPRVGAGREVEAAQVARLQSLRDSSPGRAIGSGCLGWDSRLPDFGSWIGALRSAVAPRVGAAERRRWRPCGGPGWRGWEPPPQSLRDSSPSGGAIGSGCSGETPGLAGFGSGLARCVRRWP